MYHILDLFIVFIIIDLPAVLKKQQLGQLVPNIIIESAAPDTFYNVSPQNKRMKTGNIKIITYCDYLLLFMESCTIWNKMAPDFLVIWI